MKEERSTLAFLMFIIVSALFFVLMTRKCRSLVDTWPLNDLVIEAIVFLLIVPFLCIRLFGTSRASLAFIYIIVVSVVVYLPLLKYPNELWLYGPWDSSAHYSFAKWITDKGHVPVNNELFYSDQYGHHPGNGLLPAVISIVSMIDLLPVSMSMVLLASYISYALLLLSLARVENTRNVAEYMLILSLISLSTLYLPYYGGVELAYAHTAIMVYLLVSSFISKNRLELSHTLSFIITYLGLLATHLSTAIIVLFFLIFTLSGSLLINKNDAMYMRRGLTSILFLTIILFFAYELYVDIYLIGLTLEQGIQRLVRLYVYELEISRLYTEINPNITMVDLVIYLASNYTKYFIILASIGIYSLYFLSMNDKIFRKSIQVKTYRSEEIALFALLLFSMPTWFIGWFGVGKFLSGGRALPLIQFLFCINILRRLSQHETFQALRSIGRATASLVFISLFLLGFISNFSIHMGPYIMSLEGDTYTYPVWTQGAVSPFVLDSIRFLNRFLAEDSTYRFLCVQPYTGFGLCDLLWNKPKIPVHGFVSPRLTTSGAMIQLLDKYVDVIIPMPSSDEVVPGPIGYTSLYRNPFLYILAHGGGIIYSNPYYKLVIK